MKRSIAFILALAMMICVFAMTGCGDTEQPATTTTKSQTPVQTTTGGDQDKPTQTTAGDEPTQTTTEATESTETTTETPLIPVDPMESWEGLTKLPGFENVDFRGEEFVICARTTDDVSFPSDIEIYSEEPDAISTAIRERNALIESLYNCTIRLEPSEDPPSLVNAEVTSGKQTIDMYTVHYAGERMATSGNNYNLLSLGIDFSNEWWDQNYAKSYTIKSASGTPALYGMVGDFALTAYTATHALFFNKNVYETQIEQALGYDIYQLVRDGDWTMDVFVEMIKKAGTDNNGNSAYSYSEGDILGWARTTHATHGLHAATGLQLITNENQTLSFNALNNVNAWSVNIDKAIEVWNVEQAETLGYTDVRNALTAGNTLFASEVLDVLRRMKDADVSCGLVPYPKYSKAQENYAHYVDNHLTAYCVPTSVVEIETMGQFIELFAAHSRKIVRSAWIDTYAYEYCGDADSAEMLDIVLNTRTYDPGYIYWATIEGEVSQMINSGKNNFTKWVDKRAASITGAGGMIETYISKLAENEI